MHVQHSPIQGKANFNLTQIPINGGDEADRQETKNMSFAIEKIPQEELARSDSDQIGFNLKLSSRWAIDRDRDAFIVLSRTEGGAYEGTQTTDYYTLSWKNELIHIAADPLPKKFSEQGAVMSWCVRKLTLPEIFKDQKAEVLQLVRDAFRAIGEAFNGERFISVDVEFEGN